MSRHSEVHLKPFNSITNNKYDRALDNQGESRDASSRVQRVVYLQCKRLKRHTVYIF